MPQLYTGSKMDRLIYIFAIASLARPGLNLLATNKLSLASWGSYSYRDHKGPGTYAYGYDIEDPVTGNIQFRQEERHPNGTITGSYGYVDANGLPRVTHYISDVDGYRVLTSKPNMHLGIQSIAETHKEPVQHENNHLQPDNSAWDNRNTNKIYSPPPLIYEFHGNAPFLNYYRNSLTPIPVIYNRK